MAAKTEEEAGTSKVGSSGAETGGKPAADGAGQAPAGQSAGTPGLDAAFKSLITSLLHKQLNSIKLELRELQAAAGNSNPPNVSSSGVAALLGETSAHAASSAPTGSTNDELLRSIKAQLDKLEKQLGSGGAGGGSEDLAKTLADLSSSQSKLGHQVVEQVVQHVGKDLHAIAKYVSDFRQALDGRLGKLEEAVRGGGAPAATPVAVPVKPQAPAQPQFQPVDADEDEWKEAILGEDLCRDMSLGEARTRLFRGVLAGDSAAKALAGQMMLAQAASVDRFPPLMKEVGEAYYRWRPKTAGVNDPFETALAAWLKRRCDAEGLGNTIELVIVGDRFDATRHNALERGAEITAVQGWVVLRDNGKVYTKANVSVK
jgi:hypothetical protein